MKLGCICPNLPGHINPMTALARQLQERGHEVVFLYSSSANGFPCIPGDKHDDMNANRPEISKLEGNEALALYCSIAAKETEAIFKSFVPIRVRAERNSRKRSAAASSNAMIHHSSKKRTAATNRA